MQQFIKVLDILLLLLFWFLASATSGQYTSHPDAKAEFTGQVNRCSDLSAAHTIPYHFECQTIAVDRDTQRHLLEVRHPGASFIRLCWGPTELAEGSYLLLEGVDGNTQRLTNHEMEERDHCSPAFCGSSVRVSLVERAGNTSFISLAAIQADVLK